MPYLQQEPSAKYVVPAIVALVVGAIIVTACVAAYITTQTIGDTLKTCQAALNEAHQRIDQEITNQVLTYCLVMAVGLLGGGFAGYLLRQPAPASLSNTAVPQPTLPSATFMLTSTEGEQMQLAQRLLL